jgi:hypothetical protein
MRIRVRIQRSTSMQIRIRIQGAKPMRTHAHTDPDPVSCYHKTLDFDMKNSNNLYSRTWYRTVPANKSHFEMMEIRFIC